MFHFPLFIIDWRIQIDNEIISKFNSPPGPDLLGRSKFCPTKRISALTILGYNETVRGSEQSLKSTCSYSGKVELFQSSVKWKLSMRVVV